jgi:predicted Rossmann fold flavoprotein
LPQSKIEAIGTALIAAKAQVPKRLILNHCPVNLPNRLWEYLVARAGIELDKRWADLSNKSIEGLIKELAQGEYSIEGKSAFKEEFVTCGGVNLKQVDFKTMESRCCPGLFFAGEILDIDGVTGGFNFQSAWTTAWLAGQSIGNA